jgi:hypothetical protein
LETDLPKKYGYLSGVIFWKIMTHKKRWMFEDGCLGGVIFGRRFLKNGWMFEWGNLGENDNSQERMDV